MPTVPFTKNKASRGLEDSDFDVASGHLVKRGKEFGRGPGKQMRSHHHWVFRENEAHSEPTPSHTALISSFPSWITASPNYFLLPNIPCVCLHLCATLFPSGEMPFSPSSSFSTHFTCYLFWEAHARVYQCCFCLPTILDLIASRTLSMPHYLPIYICLFGKVETTSYSSCICCAHQESGLCFHLWSSNLINCNPQQEIHFIPWYVNVCS